MASVRRKQNFDFGTEDLQSDLGLHAARGAVVTIASQGLKFALNLAATIILARLLTPEDYGLLGMVAVVTGFVELFKDLGLSSATIQRAELNQGQISTLFWLNVAGSVAITILTMALAPIVARFYGDPRLISITIATAAGFLCGGLTVQHEALLKRRMHFAALATAEILSLMVAIVIAIALAWHGARYWALVISQLINGLVYAACVWTACRWRPGSPVLDAGTRSMLAFGRHLTAFSVMNYFARNLDNLLIGRYWGSDQLGLYARAYQLLTLPIDQINTPIAAVAVPALSPLATSPERYRQAYLSLLEAIAFLTMPLMAFMIVTSDWIVSLLLGPQWYHVSQIFQFLAIAGFVQPICNTTGWLFVSQGRTKHMFQWGMIGSSIIIVSIVAGLPWGAVGVAASYSATFICVVTPLLFWFVGRTGPVRTLSLYVTVAPVALASLCALATSAAFRHSGPVTSPFVGIMSSALVTVATLFGVLTALPAGRRRLSGLKQSLALLLPRKRVSL